MKIGVNIKIDVTKLDKNRFFKGQKGTYADLTAFIDIDNTGEFGDNGIVTQSVSKAERESKVQMPIIGNSKVFYKDGGGAETTDWPGDPSSHQGVGGAPSPQASTDDFENDIPF